MSSYLNIYIKAKGNDKPIEIVSWSRSDDIYSAIDDVINIPWSGKELQYTELTVERINEVIEELKQDIDKADKRIIEYEKHADGNTELIDEILSQKEYRESLDEVLKRLYFLSDIIYDAKEEFSDVEKVLCSIT